jgi:hypothetical protein
MKTPGEIPALFIADDNYLPEAAFAFGLSRPRSWMNSRVTPFVHPKPTRFSL